MKTFADELADLINKHGIDADCGANDFIVAEFLSKVLLMLTEMKTDLVTCRGDRIVRNDGDHPMKFQLILDKGESAEVRTSPLHGITGDHRFDFIRRVPSDDIVARVTSTRGKDVPTNIVDALIADISDRRGLKREWNAIDEDVKREIRNTWMKIVDDHLVRGVR